MAKDYKKFIDMVVEMAQDKCICCSREEMENLNACLEELSDCMVKLDQAFMITVPEGDSVEVALTKYMAMRGFHKVMVDDGRKMQPMWSNGRTTIRCAGSCMFLPETFEVELTRYEVAV